MSDDAKSWWEIILGAGAVAAIWEAVRYVLSGRKKEYSESEKTSAEAEAVKLEIKIKKEDHYEKKFNEAMALLEKMEEKNRKLMEENQQQQKDIQSLKRMITMLKIQLPQE